MRSTLADGPVAHQLAGHAELLHGALHGAGLQHPAVGVHGLHHLEGLVDVVGEGLLAVDVLARPQGGQRDDGVPVIRGGDAHRVDVLAGEELAEVAVGRTSRQAGRGKGRVVLVHPLPGGLAPRRVHVADRDDLDVLVQEGVEQPPRLDAHADESDSETVARRGLGRPDPRGQDEGQAGHGLDDVSPGWVHVFSRVLKGDALASGGGIRRPLEREDATTGSALDAST